MDPPPIKIGPGRPRKSWFKSPHEDPKQPGRLTKHGVQMTCTLCKSTTHNKRKCPEKGKVPEVLPQPKKPRGRPKIKLLLLPWKHQHNNLHITWFLPNLQQLVRGAVRRSERSASSSTTIGQVNIEYLKC